MKKTLLSFLLLLACLCSLQAQIQSRFYEAGYIIQQGDTLQGFIQRNDEQTLSHSIHFKENLTDPSSSHFSPSHLQGFGFLVDGLHFSSIPLTLNKSQGKETQLRFAKRLAGGKLNLYKILLSRDESRAISLKNTEYLYVVEKDQAYHSLGEYETTRNGRTVTDKKYQGVLAALINDCGNAQPEISSNFRYQDEDFIEVIESYNRCIDPQGASVLYNHKVKAQIKHGVEANLSRISVKENAINPYSLGFSAGYFWDITNPDLSRLISQRLGVNYMFTQFSVRGSNAQETIPLKFHFIRIPLQLQFNTKENANSSFAPFFNLGITPHFTFSSEMDNYWDTALYVGLGCGAYVNRLKFNITFDNRGILMKGNQILGIGLGYRLD